MRNYLLGIFISLICCGNVLGSIEEELDSLSNKDSKIANDAYDKLYNRGVEVIPHLLGRRNQFVQYHGTSHIQFLSSVRDRQVHVNTICLLLVDAIIKKNKTPYASTLILKRGDSDRPADMQNSKMRIDQAYEVYNEWWRVQSINRNIENDQTALIGSPFRWDGGK
jgi:hypothetical protein